MKIKGIKQFTNLDVDATINSIENTVCGIYRIEPQTASYLLEYYGLGNRKLKDANLTKIAGDIAAGRFIINGETIIFEIDEDGIVTKLANGQHRLHACIKANKSFFTYITFGLKSNVMGTIDSGAARNAADCLIIDGIIEKNAPLYGQLGRSIIAIEDRKVNPYRKHAISNNEIVALVNRPSVKKRIKLALEVSRFGRPLAKETGLSTSVCLLWTYYALKRGYSEEVIDEFLHLFTYGTDRDEVILGPRHIVTRYRKKIPNMFTRLEKIVDGKRIKLPESAKKSMQYNLLTAAFNDWITSSRSLRTTTLDQEKLIDIEKVKHG